MKTVFLICCLSASMLYAQQPSTQPTLPDNVKLELFLLVGQSNMAGRGKVEPQDQTINPRVWVLNQQDKWAPAVDPLHWDRPDRVGVGPGRTFGLLVAEKYPSAQIGLIPTAVGGSSIDLWKKDGEFYQNAIKRTRLAMQRGTIKAILWHQGEADSVPEKLADHPAKLKQLVADLRADLGNPNLPFILGQVGEFHATRKPDVVKMNQILMDAPKSISRSICVPSAGLSQMGDDTHFDSAGARELGKRYAQAYFDLTK